MPEKYSQVPAVDQVGEQQESYLREAIAFAWRHWKFVGSVTGVTLVVAIIYLLRVTPLYTATANILLERPNQTTPAMANANDYPSYNDISVAMINNQLAIIKSSEFLRRVVEKEHLVSDPEFGAHSAAAASVPEKPDVAQQEAVSTAALTLAVTAQRSGLADILSISVTSIDPQRAASLANAVANAFIVEKLDARFDAAKRASAWLSDRLGELRNQLHDSEEAVVKFRAAHGLVQSGTTVTLSQQQLQDLNAKLVVAKTDLAQKKAAADLARAIQQKGGNIQSVPGLPVSPTLQSLRVQEASISQKVADLRTRYSERHPLVINAEAQQRDTERAINAELQRMANDVINDYQLAKAREGAVESEFRQATGQSGTDDQSSIALSELERTAAVNKTLFENFLQKSKIAQDQTTFQVQDARVITPAGVPDSPSSPKKGRTMMMALVLGLLLGVGAAYAKERLNSGFTTIRQAEDLLRLPVLASIPSLQPSDITQNGQVYDIPRYVTAVRLSRLGESIRSLRTNIQMTDVDDPPKVIQLTSTMPNEGKTTMALSLANSAAASKLKVLFVDADLRHSSATRYFGLLKEPGLVDMLLDDDPLKHIRYNDDANLWVIGAGRKTHNPVDMLESERMHNFVQGCKEAFDLIVFDTPPVGPVVDALIVSRFVDKIVYLIRWGATPRALIEQSIKRFPDANKLSGVVYNQVDERSAQKYGRHGYEYYYGLRDYQKYYQK